MYACINCLNNSSVGAEAGAAIGETGGAGAGASGAGVAPGLAEGGVGVPNSTSEGVELLERVDFLEPLADLLEPSRASLRATL